MRHCCGRCWRGTDERRWSRHEAGPRVLVLAIRRGRGLCAVGVVYSVTVKELTHAVHEILSDAMENQLKGNTAADMTIAVFTMDRSECSRWPKYAPRERVQPRFL